MGRFYTIENDLLKVVFCDVGASIVSIFMKDREGILRDIVLGFDTPYGYEDNASNYGATVGRYGGRIKDSSFELNGVKYELECNDGLNCLHGGSMGFSSELFSVVKFDRTSIVFELHTPNLYQGFPGSLKVNVLYKLTEDGEIKIKYSAVSDEDTFVNIINHTYFNLSGNPLCEIYGHSLKLRAGFVLGCDEEFVVDGSIEPVDNTPFDFRAPKTIGRDINMLAKGYNHNYVLDTDRDIEKLAARLECDLTGIYLEIYTDSPCMQVYSAYFSDGSEIGKKRLPLLKASGICLEAQGYTDVNHHKNFPDELLKKGEVYENNIIYKFGNYQVGQLNEQ